MKKNAEAPAAQTAKPRFSRLRFFKFEEGEPRGSWMQTAEAMHVTDAIRAEKQFVIVEYFYSFASYSCFTLYYYATEEDLKNAFTKGLERFLRVRREEQTTQSPRRPLKLGEAMRKKLDEYSKRSSPFIDFFDGLPGHLSTVRLKDFVRPWLFATQDQKIRGERIIEPRYKKS